MYNVWRGGSSLQQIKPLELCFSALKSYNTIVWRYQKFSWEVQCHVWMSLNIDRKTLDDSLETLMFMRENLLHAGIHLWLYWINHAVVLCIHMDPHSPAQHIDSVRMRKSDWRVRGGSKSHSTASMWSIIAHTYKEPSLFSKPQIESTVIVRFRASKRRVHNCCSKMSRKDSTARFVVTARLLGPDQSTKKRGKV